MEYKIKVQRMVKEDVVVGKEVKCDVCGSLIRKVNENKTIYCIGKHYELKTGHNDWGNDSVESIEEKDICSEACLRKEFAMYLCRGGTSYFEVLCRDCTKVGELT